MGLYTSHVPGEHERLNSSRIKGERLNQSEALYDVLIFLVAAVVVVPAFRRLRLSPILGYLAAGILIGPYGLAIIRDSESAQTLAEFGVVFLLFMIGLEISLERMRVLGRYVFGLGTLQVAITGLLIGGILTVVLNYFLDNSFQVGRIDWYYLPVGMVFLWVLGQVAVLLPARRAANIAPAMATRSV